MSARSVIDVQFACGKSGLPTTTLFRRWATAVLSKQGCARGELVIRLVDEEEGAALNQTYRGKRGPTNVLSFPFEAPPGLSVEHLGDLVICVPVVLSEAEAQGKPVEAHFAHMVVHGTLHLLGLDQQGEIEAETMEALEIAVVGQLGYPNPYKN